MEVNPFHNGHKYFLEEIRKRYPDDFIVVVISTTISQRGEISVLSKMSKTNILVDNNVDLVVEMPIVATTQGGEYFAYETVKALDKLGIELLIFGSESNDKNMLSKCDVQREGFKNGINRNLKNIKSNDILGISYVKAIKKINSSIDFELVKREGTDYNSNDINSSIISATAIRNNYGKNIIEFLPKYSFENMFLIDQKPLLDLLKINLINIKRKEDIFLSENGELINKAKKNMEKDFETLLDFAKICSDKNNSKYKFMRLFISVIFDIRIDDKKILEENEKYKVLGFNKKYSKFIKNNASLFLSYKERTKAYDINDKVDKILNVFYPEDINYKENYIKPIIK